MKRHLGVALALEVRDDGLPDETRVAHQVEHLVEPVVQERELEAVLCAIDGEHARAAFTIKAEYLLAAHARYVDRHVQRTDDACVSAPTNHILHARVLVHCLVSVIQFSTTSSTSTISNGNECVIGFSRYPLVSVYLMCVAVVNMSTLLSSQATLFTRVLSCTDERISSFRLQIVITEKCSDTPNDMLINHLINERCKK